MNKEKPIWSEAQNQKVERFLSLKCSIRSLMIAPLPEDVFNDRKSRLMEDVENADLFIDQLHHLQTMIRFLVWKAVK